MTPFSKQMRGQTFICFVFCMFLNWNASPALAQPAILNADSTLESNGQGNAPQPEVGPTSPLDELKSQLERVQADQTSDEAVRTKLMELYTSAIVERESAQAAAAKLEARKQDVTTADARHQRVLQQLEASPPKPEPPDPNAELVQLQAELTTREAARTQKAQELEDTEAELARRAERRIEVPKSLTEARQKLAETEVAINAPRPEDEDPLITEATRSLQQARRDPLGKQIALLEQELPAYDTTAKFMTASVISLPANLRNSPKPFQGGSNTSMNSEETKRLRI